MWILVHQTKLTSDFGPTQDFLVSVSDHAVKAKHEDIVAVHCHCCISPLAISLVEAERGKALQNVPGVVT